MPVSERFVTRAYQPGDETAILQLFERCFHVRRTIEHFRWKYLQNPYGNAHISLTFDPDGRLVGHYCGYPVPYVDSGREIIAHQIGDTMTDPSIRHVGRGPTSILGQTALHFYTNFCEGKIAFNYGFNVANIQRFSLRFLRSDRVEPVSYWYRDDPIARTGNDLGIRLFFRRRRSGVPVSGAPGLSVPPLAISRMSRCGGGHGRHSKVAASGRLECVPRSRRSIVVGRCAVRSGARRCGRDFDSSRGAELSCGSRRSLVFAAAAVACRRSYRNRFCGRS